MPITIKATEGLFDKPAAQKLTKDITDAFLKINGAFGNEFMSKNQIADFQFIPEGQSVNGLGIDKYVIITMLVPSIALATDELRETFIDTATKIVIDATNRMLDPDKILIEMTYGVMWGIGGKLYTEKDLQDGIAAAASCTVN